MKKLLAILMTIALVACCVSVASAADPKVTVKLIAGDVDADGKVLVTLNVTLADGVDIGATDIELEYDSTKLEPSLASKKNFAKTADAYDTWLDEEEEKEATAEFNENADQVGEGIVKIGIIHSDGVLFSGDWYVMGFKVKADFTEGSADIKVKSVTAKSAAVGAENYADADIATVDTAVVLEGPAPSDTSSDDSSVVVPPVSSDDDSSVVVPPVSSDDDSSVVVPPVSSDDDSSVAESDVESDEPVESEVKSEVDDVTKTEPSKNNDKLGDASSVVVAGVLCAAMAAAFVLTKKAR